MYVCVHSNTLNKKVLKCYIEMYIKFLLLLQFALCFAPLMVCPIKKLIIILGIIIIIINPLTETVVGLVGLHKSSFSNESCPELSPGGRQLTTVSSL